MKRLGVLGWPVAHSRSPQIHNAALAALALHDWHYQRLPVPPQLFEETARALRGAGFVGANVTIPHKRAALELADEASEAARAIGAANTLSFKDDGRIAAENTDAAGFIAALPVDPRGLRALVLGAGGSARAIVWALREAGASEVSIYNRTPERAKELAAAFGAVAVERAVSADLLVNCTSVGLEAPTPGATPANPPGKRKTVSGPGSIERLASEDRALNQQGLTFDQVGEYSYVTDLVYRTGSAATPLLAAATAHGAQTVDGLEILVAQGALSLRLWSGREPPLEVMRAAARDERL
jgi:shikimate dehydrogenase